MAASRESLTPDASPATVPAPAITETASSAFELNVDKLHELPSEQQSLQLLTFTAALAEHVESLNRDGLNEEQAAIKSECFKIINLTSPPPSRIIQLNLGRCFRAIFSKGNRKPLYESINECAAIVNGIAKEKDVRSRHAAAYCLGVIFETAGDSAISLSPLAGTTLLKSLKSAVNDTGFRSVIYRALGKIIKGNLVTFDEDIAKSIWKQARNAVANDRSLLVQGSALSCLEQIMRYTSHFDDSNSFEKLQAALWKAMDSSSIKVRHAAASCLVTVFVKCYDEAASDNVAKVRKVKKPKKTTAPEDLAEDENRPSSPAPEKPATALSFNLIDAMKVLSTQYSKPITTNRVRAGIAICYIKFFRSMGVSLIDQRYHDIAKHLYNDLLNHHSLQFNRYRQLMTRRFVAVILDQTVARMLGETGQLNACRFLLNDILKDFPQVIPERPEPSKQTLIAAVRSLTMLIKSLDLAITQIADMCREALLQVLQYPNFTVQIYTAHALRAFTSACPQQLLPTITICMNSLSRELNLLSGPRKSPKRCVGYAHGLAAVLSTSEQHAIYGSVDVFARVLQQATSLLKTSASSELRVSACQLQVAWTMIGGLMSLGPNFVKIHLSQLLLLWKNALPKPVGRDNKSQRNMVELSYLANVRECALGSVRAFLVFNRKLLTSDIARRLSSMLENTVAFLQSLPSKKISDDPANRLHPTLQLYDYEIMARRRVFQCYAQLLSDGPLAGLEEVAHSNILPLAIRSFSDAEYYTPSSLGATIASAAGSFETIWEVADNHGYGVTSLVSGLNVCNPVTRQEKRHWSSRKGTLACIDDTLLSPIGSSWEYDATSCYLIGDNRFHDPPVQAGTETVNSALATFALALPLQPSRIQESLLEQIADASAAAPLQKDPARRSAVIVNIATALLAAMEVATAEIGSIKGDIRRDSTEKSFQSLCHLCIKDSDDIVRFMGAHALGKLCSNSGTTLTTAEVKTLIDTIVNDREPHVRAGCALALSTIHSHLGGMAAGFHMKTIIGMLMSLAADAHPLVHFWALESLTFVVQSAGLNFASHATSAIGLLSQLYSSPVHDKETAVLASSNTAMQLSVTAVIVKGIDAIIDILGPDLQDMVKSRDMVLVLVRTFTKDADADIELEALHCLEHLSLYAPAHVDLADYVRRLQADLDSNSPEVPEVAIDGLGVLMRRGASEIIAIASPGLENRLWDYLNWDPNQSAIQKIFINWLHDAGTTNPAEWIQRCNDILTKTMSRVEPSDSLMNQNMAGSDLQDDEVAGFAVTAGAQKLDDSQVSVSTQELLRWQVRLFAMERLYDLITMISKEAAVSHNSVGESALQRDVAEVIRIAFTASTAGVVALRVVGLRIIDQILRMFGRTQDPDFPEAMLLEQYQAQISSALTPAFAADSSPELAAAAVTVCATFIATGIVTDVERMGRILKVLVSALDSFAAGTEMANIGELKSLTSNAQIMVRMAVFSAWAELQIARTDHKYLDEVVQPQIARLLPLWLSSLREYARLRFEPEISASVPIDGLVGDLDTVYASLNRQTLLRFYQDTWLSLVEAIASLIDEDSAFVFDALDSKTLDEAVGSSTAVATTNGTPGQVGINYREEPVAFFFVLFGLAFESLAVRTKEDEVVIRQRNLDILRALKKILRPSVSGNAIYQEVVFAETMDLLDRMVLVESLTVQTVIVDIARNLCIAHPSSRSGQDSSANDGLSDDIEQLFELTRIIVLVLAGLIPGLSDSPVVVRLESSEEAVNLARGALEALVDVSNVFPSIIKTDLHATIFHVFVVILGTGACQTTLVPRALPIFKRFITGLIDDVQADTERQIQNALSRMLAILKNAQQREAIASIPCEKNTLLMMTMLISLTTSSASEPDPLVKKFATEMQSCLETPSTSRIAAGCIRTLMLSNIEAEALMQQSLAFLLRPSEFEELADSRALVVQTLIIYASRAEGRRRAPAFMLIVSALLARAENEGSQIWGETARSILELAASDGAVFRSMVLAMPAKQQALLEQILKTQSKGQQNRRDEEGEREPTITLKMNF